MFPTFNLSDYIMHHIVNSHEWHIPFFGAVGLGGFLTMHALMMFIGTALVLILFLVLYRKDERVPAGLTNCLEMFVVFIRDEVAIPSLGEKDGLLFTPMLCTLFFFILVLNLLGLIPLFEPATANINVTGPLAYLILVLMVVGTLVRNGPKGIWHAMIPSTLPKLLIPFFLVTEVVSILVRTVALAIRLFANMIAGHMVILSFLGLVVLFGWWAMLAPVVAVFFYCLDIFVAFLQAYIFILLSAVFIGQMYHPEH
ncbi:MAG: F0F1 ATP synthase subunit A [Candidatus Omnitrophica bacterium]|nr:F0F1 ATP synthase subunit A [Candidatus Omnitrophota bacterium]MDE2009708.1 F0F1 ATP synthase subunit A [Candidatus Omnitrophota bacterium]MDE2213895.1 F0F1 ATP synthase subunit A [Candidatus Omnitrophota bacterium]MDE2231846.1 F0F1 ATP synthase subunit A [Candidatus Omnitrophota bacterium]